MNVNVLLVFAVIIFGLGIYGVIAKRDLLRIVISVTLMLGSLTILAVLLAGNAGNAGALGMGYSIVLFVWVVEVVEVLIALALFIYLARSGKVNISDLEDMKW